MQNVDVYYELLAKTVAYPKGTSIVNTQLYR